MSGIARSAEQQRPAQSTPDPLLWQALGTDAPTAAFAEAWLTLQCRALGRTLRAVLVLRQPDRSLAPAAHWPAGDGGSAALARAAETALAQQRGVATQGVSGPGGEGRPDVLAYPLRLDGAVAAVAAVECTPAGEAALRETMRQLQWGMATVEAVLRRQLLAGQSAQVQATTKALEIAATTLAAPRFGDAARALATALATELNAIEAAVGWRRGRSARLEALSHGTSFSRRMDTVRRAVAAMDAAIDQERSLAYPPPAGGSPLGTAALSALSAAREGAGILSVPLVADDRIRGAILLVFPTDAPITQSQVDIAEAVAGLLGPVFATLYDAERWLARQLWDIFLREARRLLGPSHYILKLSTLAAAAVIAFFALYRTEFRVSARAVVEGETKRSIAAALDGYLASEHARSGQVVHQGDLLATLDSSELVLQRLRWVAQREQRRLELDKALAAGQRAEVNINQAQMDEATAQIALLDEQIARTKIIAPFDGLILNGDLSQSVGAAVQRTQVLFEIAPLEAYRIIARVPDADIDWIKPGQAGQIVLSALPDDRFGLTVTSVTPTTETIEGVNAFKVEAHLAGGTGHLRPNMEGVARIDAGRHLLIWIWTHRLIESARLWVWSWWP
jgi:multidrug resistance efflux pump